jgi:hypothetical protein
VSRILPVTGISSDLWQHQRSEDEKRRQRDKKLDTFTEALKDAMKDEGKHDKDRDRGPVR